jgi:hypothetical protein
MTREELIANGFVLGHPSRIQSVFDPPIEMPAHVAVVHMLLSTLQRKRRERQTAVEVGVWQGAMSRWLLSSRPGLTLHMVDPWQSAKPGDTWYDKGDKFAKRPQEQFEENYKLAQEVAEIYAPRAVLHRQPSLEAVKSFANGSLDLVFIDGAHDAANVRKDIKAWRPKVRPGGILSGHDYRVGGVYFGLVKAVEQTTAAMGLTIVPYPGKVWSCKIPE